MKILRAASLGSNFTGSYKKRVQICWKTLNVKICERKTKNGFCKKKINFLDQLF